MCTCALMVQLYETFTQYKVQKEALWWRHQPRRFCSRGWGGGKRRKYAGSISWARVVCFEDWRKYWFWVWNFCLRIQMFQSLLVCLTLSHLESITRLRRLVLRIHPSAGAGKYLAKRPNIVKSLKNTPSATAACVSKRSKYMFPNYMTKAVIPHVERIVLLLLKSWS